MTDIYHNQGSDQGPRLSLSVPPGVSGLSQPSTNDALQRFAASQIFAFNNLQFPKDPAGTRVSELLTQQSTWIEAAAPLALLAELRTVLSIGHGPADSRASSSLQTLPYIFRLQGNPVMQANNPGLEGFVFGERFFRQCYGDEASQALLPHYIDYLRDLARPVAWLRPLLHALGDLEDSKAPDDVRLRQLLHLTELTTIELQGLLRANDGAQWTRSLRAYHAYTSATPLAARRAAYGDEMLATETSECDEARSPQWFRDLSESDLLLLKDYGFNALRVMGTYPRGQENCKGDGGGSPFSIRRYEVDPELGSLEEVKGVIAAGQRHGIRTIFEFVPNHTSVDADLVREDPSLYVHVRHEPSDLTGYYELDHPTEGRFWIRHGGYQDYSGRHYFSDTLQLDLSNPETRSRVIGWARNLVREYGIHGLRIDMSHHILHTNLSACWGDELACELPSKEFLAELTENLKRENRAVAVLGEVLGGTSVEFEHLSAAGIDLIYNLDDIRVRGGHEHVGWFQALKSQDPERIGLALQRAEFLQWQRGGAGTVTFVGQHDRPAPWRELGDWVWGALFLTILQPGPLCLYAGTEAQFKSPCAEDGKMISFAHSSTIDWRGIFSEFGEHVHFSLLQARKLRTLYGDDLRMTPLRSTTTTAAFEVPWVGFALSPPDALATQDQKFSGALVLANLSAEAVNFTLEDKVLGIGPLELALGPKGPQGQKLVLVGTRTHNNN